jgi:hypothetical protein
MLIVTVTAFGVKIYCGETRFFFIFLSSDMQVLQIKKFRRKIRVSGIFYKKELAFTG